MQSFLLRYLPKAAALCMVCLVVLSTSVSAQTGSWTPVASFPAHYNEGVMLLLTDGSVICKNSSGGNTCPADENIGNSWDRLTPVNGSYVNGTWSTIASMDSPRLYFSSQVLRDGRVYVCGGEYGGGGRWGEIYNPATNTWSPTGTGGSGIGYPFPNVVSDANSQQLINGKILQACVNGAGLNLNYLYDPATNSYAAGPNCLRIDNEAVWVKLPDNSVLFMDNYGMTSERYIPATNTWVDDATAPVNLFDPYGYEAGAAYLLPDGRIWFIGSTPNTLYYTPSGSASPGTWTMGPAIPASKGAPDAASAMMPNGHVLLMLSPTPTASNHFPAPTTYYEFDYLTNTFTQISAPGGGLSSPYGSYISNTLVLPDGSVLFCNSGTDQYYVYTPGSGPLAAGRPTIDTILGGNCNSYTVIGKLFNGISEGAAYGDDWQMSTNYPIVRLTSGTNIYYATTSNWNRQGAVMTGSLADTATFTLPAGLPIGTYSVTVIANGNPSIPRAITTTPDFVTGPILGASSICASTTTTLTDTTSGGVWSSSNTAVATISTAGVVTGVSGGTAIMSYTKLYACGYQSVTHIVTVNLPSVSAVTGTSLMYIGSINAFSDATAGGTWSSSNTSVCTVGSSTGIVNGIAVGTAIISYVVTNSCGSASATILVTVSGCTPMITTIAGTGAAGYSGDGGSALSATMVQPYGIYFDHSGNIYFSDGGNSVIRKIDPSGIITTVAGTGTSGYSGDGGPATAARLNDPGSVTADLLGNLYIADTHNNRVRKVSPSGIITTIAGTGVAGYSGDGGAALAAKLNYPEGVVLDPAGNIYVSEYFNNCVRKITPAGIITTIAGNGTAGFSGDGGPATAARLNGVYSISMDAAGNLYIADGLNNRARKVNTAGIISTIAGGGPGPLGDGGPATAATIAVAIDVVADASGNVYVSDGNNSRIRKVNSAGIISTIAGTGVAGFSGDGGPAPSAMINHPGCVAFNWAGVFYICDWANNRIRKITTAMPDAGAITGALMIPVGSTTNLTDPVIGGTWSSSNMAVGTVNSTGVLTGITVGTTIVSYTVTNGCGSASAITIVTVVPLTSSCGGIITTVVGNGIAAYSGDGGLATSASINKAYSITKGADGSMYIADSWNSMIRKVSPTGIISTIGGTGVWGFSGDGGPATAAKLNGPTSVTLDAAGNLYVADQSNHRIRKINTSGIITTIAGNGSVGFSGDGGPATAASLFEPTAAALDASGNIFIADQFNNRIRKVTPAGIISTYAGSAGGFGGDGGPAAAALISMPCGICFDPSGNLYFTDWGNNRIRKITPGGIISTYAGTGSGTTSGDGGPALAAGILNPWGIACDATGNIYIGNFNEQRLRKISTSGIITTIAGTGVAGYSGDGGLATLAKVYHPSGVYAADSNNIYFADEENSRIRRIGDIRVVITGTTAVCVGSTTSLNATPAGGIWSSVNPGVATVGSISGVVTGVFPGTATISYTASTACGNIAASVVVTVNLLPFPQIILGTASLCSGSTTSLSDAAAGGVWSSVSTGVATISSTGIVTGISSGTSTISYTVTNSCGTMAATRIVTVDPGPAVAAITGIPIACVGSATALTDVTGGGTWSSTPISVATVSATGIVTGISGGTATISYTVTSSCGSTVATRIVTINTLPVTGSISGTATVCISATTALTDASSGGIWSSASAAVATVSSTGIVTGISAGTTTISYTVTNSCGTAAATIVVTVNAAPPAGTITGTTLVCVTATTALTNATGGGVWSSTIPAVAGVGSSGIVTGNAAGTSNISYTVSNGCGTNAATTIVTVILLPTVNVTTGLPVICPGAVTALTNATAGGVWSSLAPGIATVGATGLVTGVSAGTSMISYTVANACGTVAATTVATVNPSPDAGTITGVLNVCAGNAIVLSDAVTGGVWSSANPGVATISASGIVTGLALGTAKISYAVTNSCGTAYTTAIVTVNPLPNAGFILGALVVCPTTSITLSNPASGGGGVWSSASPAIAVIGSTSGVLTGISAGTAVISYTVTNNCATVFATTTVTVYPIPSPILGPNVICQENSAILSDSVSGGTWTSTNTVVATITPGLLSGEGLVTGINVGTAVISYVIAPGCFAAKTITVNPLAHISVANQICAASLETATDAPGGGTWSSSTPSVATINSAGIVTGVASGAAIISYSLGVGCIAVAPVTVNPLPLNYWVTGGGAFCSGGAGVHIGLDGSYAGTTYHLRYGSISLGAFAGTDSALDFGAYVLPGTYTVLAINDTTACAKLMGDSAVITVNAAVTPVVNIGANPGTTICAGTMTTFTALPINGGSLPLFSWYVNGIPSFSGSTYSYVPANGDVVSVILTSDAICALPDTATGSIVMTTSAGLLPSVSIFASPGDSICLGTVVVLTPLPVNGGLAPLYSWVKNGIYQGSGPVYSFMPAGGDNIFCRMHSSLTCSLEDSVYSSNNILMNVPPIAVPVVTVTAIPGNRIGAGETVMFVASVAFAGTGLSYQWNINSNPVPGAINDTFIHSGFANHDVVDCRVTGYSTCGSATRGASVMIIDTVALGVSMIQGSDVLKLIPNPNNGQFTLKGSIATNNDAAASVEITDMLGRVVYKAKLRLQNGMVDEQIQLSSNLVNGMYLLDVKWEEGRRIFHFVVEK